MAENYFKRFEGKIVYAEYSHTKTDGTRGPEKNVVKVAEVGESKLIFEKANGGILQVPFYRIKGIEPDVPEEERQKFGHNNTQKD